MVVMLCGPMTGNPELDFPLFEQYEEKLISTGIDVINPMRYIARHQAQFEEFKKNNDSRLDDDDLKWLTDVTFMLSALQVCDAILLIPDWNCAIDSMIVVLAAQTMGVKMLYYYENELRQKNIGVITNPHLSSDEPEIIDVADNPVDPKKLTRKEFDEAKKQWLKQDSDVADQDDAENESWRGNAAEIITVEDVKAKTDDMVAKEKADHLGNWVRKQWPDRFAEKGGRDDEDD